jgi:sigma-B regulation protein RsbU (phosphoserine phosphatase)
MEKTIWKEFYEDPSHDTKTNDDKDESEIGFSIQIIDSQGKCIAGTDSIDLSILKGEQNVVLSEYNMMDLKGTPYYIITQPIAHTDWKLVVFQHYNMVFLWGKVLAIVILFFMALGAVIIFFFTRHSIRRATKPLGILSDTAREVAKGNFDTALPTFKRHDEISQLRDSFDTMQHSLSRYVEELKASTAAKASIESELNVAHNIQMSMLPKSFPAFPERKDIDLYGSLTPAKGVGGDLFDFFIRDTTPSSPLQVSTSSSPLQGGNQGGEKLFFCVGDVSGKGVPAALVMAVTRTLFRNVAAHTDKPAHIVQTMNVNISEGNDNQMFVTLFAGVFDLASGRLTYCNGGHNAPYIQSATLPVEPNLPVGAWADWQFVEQETVIRSGETIFLYTDGLTEAENASQEQFGEDRTTEVIAAQTKQSASPQALIDAMTNAVHEFVGDTEQSDDLTMLAIRFSK